jgi:hypothetical protein
MGLFASRQRTSSRKKAYLEARKLSLISKALMLVESSRKPLRHSSSFISEVSMTGTGTAFASKVAPCLSKRSSTRNMVPASSQISLAPACARFSSVEKLLLLRFAPFHYAERGSSSKLNKDECKKSHLFPKNCIQRTQLYPDVEKVTLILLSLLPAPSLATMSSFEAHSCFLTSLQQEIGKNVPYSGVEK